ncbi:hypothetical protein ACFFRR_009700 [Megaselia abdita]
MENYRFLNYAFYRPILVPYRNPQFTPEEPKPQHSYIGLIAMAILSSAESKLVLSDIYQHILDHYPYFRSRGPGWRNSIRHNLSLNDCFIKSGRSANGKGHYWAIHPANIDDFKRGDFRRRKAQRKVRKHMGLSVDDEGLDSPSPPPLSPVFVTSYSPMVTQTSTISNTNTNQQSKKRLFDVASLLAPENDVASLLDSNATKKVSIEDEDVEVVEEIEETSRTTQIVWQSFERYYSQFLSVGRGHFQDIGNP